MDKLFIAHFTEHVITYSCWELSHVSKGGSGATVYILISISDIPNQPDKCLYPAPLKKPKDLNIPEPEYVPFLKKCPSLPLKINMILTRGQRSILLRLMSIDHNMVK